MKVLLGRAAFVGRFVGSLADLLADLLIVALLIGASPGLAEEFNFLNPPEGSSEAIPVSTQGPERIIGSYSNGCILGASEFPVSTANHELMNTTRNHQYGHSSLIQFVGKLGAASVKMGRGKLRVGDSSCPCGGKMGEGHSSHRIGLDVDIFYKPIPADKTLTFQDRNAWSEKQQIESEIAVYERPENATEVKSGLTKEFRDGDMKLLEIAANVNEVDRIFVSPPIKQKLCEVYYQRRNASTPAANWQWLKKIRPWEGHKSHFHVRLRCPPVDEGCKSQAPIPVDPSDASKVGCEGTEFRDWFKPKPPSDNKHDDSKSAEKSDAEKKCDVEMARLHPFSPSPNVRCLEGAAGAAIQCRKYATALTASTSCTKPELLKSPQSCLGNVDAGPASLKENIR